MTAKWLRNWISCSGSEGYCTISPLSTASVRKASGWLFFGNSSESLHTLGVDDRALSVEGILGVIVNFPKSVDYRGGWIIGVVGWGNKLSELVEVDRCYPQV